MTAADQNDSTVRTTHGPVRGAALDGVQVFKGVRYGAPPTGDHRFKPPRPPEPWREVAECRALGAPAIQHGRPPGEAFRGVIEAILRQLADLARLLDLVGEVNRDAQPRVIDHTP